MTVYVTCYTVNKQTVSLGNVAALCEVLYTSVMLRLLSTSCSLWPRTDVKHSSHYYVAISVMYDLRDSDYCQIYIQT